MKRRIQMLIMDVDGTLTDGKIYMGESGELMKTFSIKDGYGIRNLLIPQNIIPVIITGRRSKIVENRCQEIGITEIHQGINDKVEKLKQLAGEKKDFSSMAYIGDDMNDFLAMKVIKRSRGVVGCPADAEKEIRKLADFVSAKDGGNGAVREFIEWLLLYYN